MVLNNIKLNINSISLLNRFLLLYIPLVCVTISKGLFVQIQSITSFVAFSYIYLKTIKESDVKKDFFSKYLFLLFTIGTIIGLFNSAFRENDIYKWIQYSFLAFSGFIAYTSGYNTVITKKELNFIFFIFFVDMIMFIPLLITGSSSRTSIGTSNLYPLILILIFNTSYYKGVKTKRNILIYFCLLLLAYLISGMRSAIGVMLLSTFLILIYYFRISFIPKILKFIIFISMILGLSYFIIPNTIRETIHKRIEVVEERFSNTIFNDAGARLDEKEGEGRDLEALSARDEFINNIYPIDYFIGRGHGFVYFDKMQARVKAHVHISYYAMLTRYGVMGILFYISLFVYCIVNLLILFFKKRNFDNQILFGLFLSTFQILLISTIAASLIYSIHMFIIGFTIGYKKLMNNNNF